MQLNPLISHHSSHYTFADLQLDLVGLPAICTLFCRAIEAACAWTTGVRFMLTSPIGKETIPVQLAVVDLPLQSVEACSPQDLLTRWTARTTWPVSLPDEIHAKLQQLARPETLLQGQVHCEAGLVASLYLRQQRPHDLDSPESPVVTEAFAHLTAVSVLQKKKNRPLPVLILVRKWIKASNQRLPLGLLKSAVLFAQCSSTSSNSHPTISGLN